ncbi:MAG TPA: MFS transporter [Phycisphaerae bacterium]|nr:MFS transporter [Phycisphaerae bacterium]HRY69742.1 MFS transporter [Phycisphaerae bacterium]HSA29382.1 MFS transporter [Phycisphaerae bacterium]
MGGTDPTNSLPEPLPQRPTDYAGRPIGPLRLARAMTINILGGTSIMMSIAVLWPTAGITAVFMAEQLGASKTLIGMNLTLVSLATAASLPGAAVFCRLQRRRATWIIITALARSCMFGSAAVALLAGYREWHTTLIWVFMVGLLLVQGGSVFTSPGYWSWMADLIPDAIRGTFFGRRYRWMLLGQSVVTIAAGALVDRTSGEAAVRHMYFAVFMVMAALAVLDPLLFCAVPEPVRPPPERRTLRKLADEYLAPLRDKPFRNVLIAQGMYLFFYNVPIVFLPLFLRGEEVDGVWLGGHAALWLVSAVWVVYAVGTALAASQWGRLADKIGHRTVWLLSSLGLLTHVTYFFINEENYAWIALVNAAAYGVLFGGQTVAVQNLALSMAPSRQHEFYMGMFQAVTAVASAFGPLLAGWLADICRVVPWFKLPSGQPVCYMHVLLVIAFAGVFLTIPLMARIPDPMGTAVRPWLGRLISGDLWRITWNISVLGSASSVSRAVRALRRISPRDGNMMLPEIVGALDDPDLAIRREALLALGRLGTPEALDMLRWYLHEPDASVRAQSIEAISQAEIEDRTVLLKRALHDPDGRVRRAAVEALGRSEDTAAAGELRSLLAGEHDAEVLAAAAAALSNLKELGAVHEMIELALHSGNTTVRSQMLVALADLLGGSGDFQRLWRQDRHWRGSGFAKLARKIRRQARLFVRVTLASGPISRADRRRLLLQTDAEVERLLEYAEAEDWQEVLRSLQRLAFQFLRLRYRYHGDEGHAIEFLTAVAPTHAERYWLIGYLSDAYVKGTAPEAPWDGLALLATYVFVYG